MIKVNYYLFPDYAPVAQLDRAQYYGYWGWGFESLQVYKYTEGHTQGNN